MAGNKIHIKQIDGLQSQLDKSLSDVLNVGNTASQDVLMGTYSIGIGTMSPTAKLHVVGATILDGITTQKNTLDIFGTNKIQFDSSVATYIRGNLSIMELRGKHGFLLDSDSGGKFLEMSTSDYYGNKLNIFGDSFSDSNFKYKSPGLSDGSSFFQVGSQSALLHTDLVGGRVGIKTSTPSTDFHINGQLRLVDGTQANGYILTSDASGVASWAVSNSITSITDLSDVSISLATTDDTLRYNGYDWVNTSEVTVDSVGNMEVQGSVVIQGSVTVNGTTSTINTENLKVNEPIILLSGSQSGIPTLDSGIMINRGDGITQSFIWDESSDEFAMISTNDDDETQGSVSIVDYSKLHIGDLTSDGDAIINGTLTLVDGTQADGYILTSDASGVASWTASTPGVGIDVDVRTFSPNSVESVSHTLGTGDLIVQCYDLSGKLIYPDKLSINGTTSVNISFTSMLVDVKTVIMG